jgi:hypothetical protein
MKTLVDYSIVSKHHPLDTKVIVINSFDMSIVSFNVLQGRYITTILNEAGENLLSLYKIQGVLILPNDNNTKLIINELSKKIKFVIVQNAHRHPRKNCISINSTLVDFNVINEHLVLLNRKTVLDLNFI